MVSVNGLASRFNITLQHQKNTVRKQNIQIYHESIIREYSNIENAILNANFITLFVQLP